MQPFAPSCLVGPEFLEFSLKGIRQKNIALTATFDSMEDLETYRVHPEHVKVAEHIKEASIRIASVDYES